MGSGALRIVLAMEREFRERPNYFNLDIGCTVIAITDRSAFRPLLSTPTNLFSAVTSAYVCARIGSNGTF